MYIVTSVIEIRKRKCFSFVCIQKNKTCDKTTILIPYFEKHQTDLEKGYKMKNKKYHTVSTISNSNRKS